MANVLSRQIIRGGVLTVLILAVAFSSCRCEVSTEYAPSATVIRTREIIRKERFIIHAAGFVQNAAGEQVPYTNSRDALLNCYADGNKISEIDFRISSDGFLVCTHEWNQAYKDGKPLSDAVTQAEFLTCKIYGEFTAMTLSDLALFMREAEDFRIVTDIKDNNIAGCAIIARTCPDLLDRFIIQIYHAYEYDIIRALGFRNIIYTLYRTSESERNPAVLEKFAQTHPLVGFTYWDSWADTYLDTCKRMGIPSFVHTVNDREKREEFLRAGVAAVYTDVTDN